MIEVKQPINPIISESQFHDAIREENEIKKNMDEFFGDNDVEVHI